MEPQPHPSTYRNDVYCGVNMAIQTDGYAFAISIESCMTRRKG